MNARSRAAELTERYNSFVRGMSIQPYQQHCAAWMRGRFCAAMSQKGRASFSFQLKCAVRAAPARNALLTTRASVVQLVRAWV